MILTSKYVIIHGRLREISDEELMHWKYIKREKKNGKWVYYYDEDAANKGLRQQQASIREARADEFNKQQAYNHAKKAADAQGLNDGRRTFYGDQIATMNKQLRAENKYKAAVKKTEKVVKKYERMKVSKNINKAVNKGIAKLANLFSGSSKKRG